MTTNDVATCNLDTCRKPAIYAVHFARSVFPDGMAVTVDGARLVVCAACSALLCDDPKLELRPLEVA